MTFTLQNLTTLTSHPGEYELSLRAVGARIADAGGNELPVGTFDLFLVVADADFNDDEKLDVTDVDALVAEIVAGTHDSTYDVTGDGFVDPDDLTEWLAVAGAANLVSMDPYRPGDANLDGAVNGTDHTIWFNNRFTSVAAWSQGDFTANGKIDIRDWNVWNQHKFIVSVLASSESSGGPIRVPRSAASKTGPEGTPQSTSEATMQTVVLAPPEKTAKTIQRIDATHAAPEKVEIATNVEDSVARHRDFVASFSEPDLPNRDRTRKRHGRRAMDQWQERVDQLFSDFDAT